MAVGRFEAEGVPVAMVTGGGAQRRGTRNRRWDAVAQLRAQRPGRAEGPRQRVVTVGEPEAGASRAGTNRLGSEPAVASAARSPRCRLGLWRAER